MSRHTDPGGRYTCIRAIHRALALIEQLATEPHGARITDLAATNAIHKSSVHRLLAGLQTVGWVERQLIDHRYRLTPKVVSLGLAMMDTIGSRVAWQTHLDAVAAETGELSQLAVVQGQDMLYVAKAEGDRHVRVVGQLGRRIALHTSSAGRVWLASLPEEVALRTVLGQARSNPPEDPTPSIARMLHDWEHTRQQGYAAVVEDSADHLNSIAAPVRVGSSGQGGGGGECDRARMASHRRRAMSDGTSHDSSRRCHCTLMVTVVDLFFAERCGIHWMREVSESREVTCGPAAIARASLCIQYP